MGPGDRVGGRSTWGREYPEAQREKLTHQHFIILPVVVEILPLCLPVSTGGLTFGWLPAGFWLAKQPGKGGLVSASRHGVMRIGAPPRLPEAR